MSTIRTDVTDHPRTIARATWMIRLAAAVVGVAALAVIAFGLTLVVEDLSTRSEMFDGLGVFFGLVLCGLGAILVAVAGFVTWLAGRHTFAAALVLCAFGVLLAAIGFMTLGALGGMVSAAFVAGALLVGGLGLGAAVEARVAIASPGGSTR